MEKAFQTSIFIYDFYSEIFFLPIFSVYLDIFLHVQESPSFYWPFIWNPLWSIWPCACMGGRELSCGVGRRDGEVKGTSQLVKPALHHGVRASLDYSNRRWWWWRIAAPHCPPDIFILAWMQVYLETRISLVLYSVEILTVSNTSGKSLHQSVSTSSCVRVMFIVGKVSELMPFKLFEDRVLQTSLFSLVWPSV